MSKQPDAFAALGDPTRRAIVTLLCDESPLTAGAVAGAFPGISRPAVSKHLRVLRQSGLVSAEQSGREWRYRLEVAALARMQRDWFAQFAPLIEQSLANLKVQAETPRPLPERGRC